MNAQQRKRTNFDDNWKFAFGNANDPAREFNTLAMIDIGDPEVGLALVNGTAVLVMAYTLGGFLAPGLGGLALQLSPAVGFPALLLLIAGVGVAALHARRLRW